MAGSYPNNSDNDVSLVKKQAWNWYEFAVASGVSGLNPPNWSDNKVDLLKKITYYTASVASI